MADRPDVAGWLAALSDDEKRGLVGRLDTQALLGDAVEILELTTTWARVALTGQPTGDGPAGYPVWMPRAQLAPGRPAADLPDAIVATVTVPVARFQVRGAVIGASFGTTLPVRSAKDAVVEVDLPRGDAGVLAADDVAIHATADPALRATAASIVASMRLFLGLPYLWAGTSAYGFDCSGLVHLVHRVHGIELPRDTGPMSEVGALVDPDDRRPGDLVFFERDGDVHHVVTWLGDGRVIESPKTGLAVREIALEALPYAHEVTLTRRVLEAA